MIVFSPSACRPENQQGKTSSFALWVFPDGRVPANNVAEWQSPIELVVRGGWRVCLPPEKMKSVRAIAEREAAVRTP